jgi:beta-glucanase (GH16 family)
MAVKMGFSFAKAGRSARVTQNRMPKSSLELVAILIVIGILGTVFLLNTHAATPVNSIEAESGTPFTAATKVIDSTASGGSAIKFGSGSGAVGGGCLANCTPPAPLLSGKSKWNLAFDDEFSESSLDTTKFSPCFDWDGGGCTSSFNNGYEHYQPSQVQLSGGQAHLVAQPLSPPYGDAACYRGSCTYKSGMIATSRPHGSSNYLYTFTYGYVEASLKIPGTQGFFAAWWMLPADPSYNYNYEIDILEALGSDPTDMEMHYSYNGRAQYYSPNDSHKNGTCADLDYSQGYHRFGVDWEPTSVTFYIDGTKCGQFTGTAGGTIANTPMQLILDQMVSNDWERSVGAPLLDNGLSASLDVDYIHVFQQQ